MQEKVLEKWGSVKVGFIPSPVRSDLHPFRSGKDHVSCDDEWHCNERTDRQTDGLGTQWDFGSAESFYKDIYRSWGNTFVILEQLSSFTRPMEKCCPHYVLMWVNAIVGEDTPLTMLYGSHTDPCIIHNPMRKGKNERASVGFTFFEQGKKK